MTYHVGLTLTGYKIRITCLPPPPTTHPFETSDAISKYRRRHRRPRRTACAWCTCPKRACPTRWQGPHYRKLGMVELRCVISSPRHPSNDTDPEPMASYHIGLPTDPVQIDSIGVFPDPPQPGKNLTVQISGSIAERVEVCIPPF